MTEADVKTHDAKIPFNYVLWFDQIDKTQIPLVGGKGANLGELANAGLPVPEGFAITTRAFDFFLDANGIKDDIAKLVVACDVDDVMQLKQASDAIEGMIVKAEYPQPVKDEVKRAYEQLSYARDAVLPEALSMLSLGREYATVAVRSSATAEDLPNASFAGQQASFLNMKGVPAVLDAVRKCWASLYEPRAIFYRAKNNVVSSSICVVVQRMVEAEKAGVTFTVHPSSGKNVVIIEACWGLGEALVLGEVQPDRYVVSKDDSYAIQESHIGRKEMMHVRDPGTGRTVELRVPREKVEARVLTDEELRRLTAYAMRIEEHYGSPQDVEWCVRGQKIYIVQTRPITTLPKAGPVETEAAPEGLKAVLKGISASPGIGAGRVKLVGSLEETGKVEKGDVLVTEMTSPDFVPAMSRCIAIVTDRGGTTSHAAIVSREMGVPCVVGTQNATKVLSDGMLVTVDGNTGVVYAGAVEPRKEEATPAAAVETPVEETPDERAKEPEDEHLFEEPESGETKVEEAAAAVEEKEAEESDEAPAGSKSAIDEFVSLADELDKNNGDGDEDEKAFEEEPEEAEELPVHDKSASEESEHERDGRPKLYMNLGLPDKIDEYKRLPFDGIGLMRIEFIIAGLGEHPLAMIEAGESQKYVDALVAGIEKVAIVVRPRPVVVRFSDFKSNEYRSLKGGDRFEPQEANPMIGWRGVSRYVSPAFEQAFRLECRAMRKVREDCKNVWAMLPFVRTTWEVGKCLDIMHEEGLDSHEDDTFKVWIMAEVPAVALLADKFAELCDGFSIGSNDLTQLVLGVDRDSELLGKMGYFDERDEAVKLAIKNIVEKAHLKGRTVSICGQAPSEYPEFVRFLLDIGIDSVSVNPDAVEKTKELLKSI
ncbi:MAG: PEP-utilizing enzyme [Candidatus Aenigmarchaeota archaeon]|nr:PEP-utilizing enzyme [Candidatus Aenigmarchaeota archaeon]